MSVNNYLSLLGCKVKDKVTGFEGVAGSVCFDLYGCVQVAVMPPVADSKIEEGRWFDWKRLDVTGKKPVMPVPDYAGGPGLENGPEAKPAARAMPVR